MVQPVFVVNSGVRGRRERRGCCLGSAGRLVVMALLVLLLIGWLT